ncbi:rod shape determining protein RodA [Candidatus Planktophila dulcis]|uniref:peptidoglycan glycosyltransferase n=1 Tax=Candidatus Planktophila dulcis TaxID=1884914 RepID=A0AAC9YUM1_9ACTN|nr:rod shape-determining protein RodA [Candidatus Planktophila dulcis]ASY12252.1 rod shape determining protein RodA [Candidatus Planktophila dulcis]ASY21500.1 rod shape determining protein RodA [Candidatus Planktophila dulcis]
MSTFLNRSPYRRARRSSVLSGFDPVLTGAVAALLVIGTLLVYAATRDWYASNGLDPQYYLKRHVINIVIGLALAWGTTIIDYRLLRAYTPYIWGLGVFGLLFVLIPGVGSEVNGAKAWIRLPAGLQIQPAEIAKISIIIGIAMLLSERTHNNDAPSHQDVLKALGVAAIPILLILAQPDMGTVLIISASVVTMLAVSGAPTRWVVGLILLALVGGFVAVKAGVISDYQVKRLQSFVDPNADSQGAGYQLRQARITVGSGGLIGTGLFNGPQTNGRFVPEQQTDFIFTVAGEELGFLGSGLIIFLLFLILMRAFAIARRSTDPYGMLVCTGVIAWFAFQIFENIGMTLGLMPMTGVPLPFMSYGGSSMFANLIGFGLLQNVHASHRS